MHSASYNTKEDLQGKMVGLIGTGSSAIQILPQIQKGEYSLRSYMRLLITIPLISGEARYDLHEICDMVWVANLLAVKSLT